MAISPVLYWPARRTRGDSLYQSARREIFDRDGQTPDIISSEPDMREFFAENPHAALYIPVFVGSVGWWGGLLGCDDKSGPKITEKIILSADCQLMVIQNHKSENSVAAHRGMSVRNTNLFVAEIHPSSQFFKKMSSQIAMSIDMLATDSGTILGLFSGRNKKKFATLVESTGNSYLGCVGWY